MKQKYFIHILNLVFPIIIFFNGCAEDKSPLEPFLNIDSKIAGSWYCKTLWPEPVILNNPSANIPKYQFRGLNISPDGVVTPMAIEANTGKLLTYHPNWGSDIKIIEAKYGKVLLETENLFNHISGTYKGAYSLFSDSIEFRSLDSKNDLPFLAGKYKKYQHGRVLADPIITEFSVMVGSKPYENDKISPGVSAYVEYSNGSLFITAKSVNDGVFEIVLLNFSGAGAYSLGQGVNWGARYSYWADGKGWSFNTSEPDSGKITFLNFDLERKRCDGSFYFTIHNGGLKLTDGTFDLPIYVFD